MCLVRLFNHTYINILFSQVGLELGNNLCFRWRCCTSLVCCCPGESMRYVNILYMFLFFVKNVRCGLYIFRIYRLQNGYTDIVYELRYSLKTFKYLGCIVLYVPETNGAGRTNMTRKCVERKENTYLSLDPAVKRAINESRGQIPFSTYVNDFLWYAFVASDEQISQIENLR